MRRKELEYERHELSGRYWEPQPDEEDLRRMEEEYRLNHEADEEEELPFT